MHYLDQLRQRPGYNSPRYTIRREVMPMNHGMSYSLNRSAVVMWPVNS